MVEPAVRQTWWLAVVSLLGLGSETDVIRGVFRVREVARGRGAAAVLIGQDSDGGHGRRSHGDI
jgi:hypothetical protein